MGKRMGPEAIRTLMKVLKAANGFRCVEPGEW